MVGHSCAICEEHVEQMITPKVKWTDEDRGFVLTEHINVGWLDSIVASEACSLCRLIKRVYEQTRPSNWVAEERIYCFIEKGSTRLSLTGERKDWTFTLGLYYLDSNKSVSRAIPSLWPPSFRLAFDSVETLGIEEETFQLGRMHSKALVDFEFMRQCFEKCRGDHGDACQHPARTIQETDDFRVGKPVSLPSGMRLIDTVEARVVFAPLHCSYVILSYVWGATNSPMLRMSNLGKMTSKGIFEQISLPYTIAHAIEVTKALGERYLWVDSLCIVQDDSGGEKALQIQSMDEIYAGAMLTLVATDQHDANGGLWRPQPGKPRSYEQVIETIGNLTFVGASPALSDVLEAGPWTRRAWTYQEHMLSRRCMFFTDYGMYFSCETAAFAEDYVHKLEVSGHKQLESGEEDPLRGVYQESGYCRFWWVAVRDMTKRSLIHEEDVLNAATGVFDHLTKVLGDFFVCGLPASTLFEAGLLWFASGFLRRRHAKVSGKLFPSWSWAGWVGKLDFEPFDEPDSISASRVITTWRLEHRHGIFRSAALSYSLANGLTGIMDSSSQEVQSVREALKCIQTGMLCFETMSANFTIDAMHWNQLITSADQEFVHTGLYRIRHNGLWIGSVHLQHSIANDLGLGSKRLHEFVAVSKSATERGVWTAPSRPLSGNSEDLVLYAEELSKDDIDVFNVLLITRDGKESRRLGVGQIHKPSFERSDWTLKEIRLG